MSEEIALSECTQYLIVRSFGPLDLNDIKLSISKMDLICKELGVDKVLIDASERNETLDSQQSMEIGGYLAELTQGRIKFAVLTSLDQQPLDFFHTVTEIKGGMVSFFQNESLALKWLGVK